MYKTIILPVLCMGMKLGLTLREEHKLKVFENRALRRIFGLKTQEMAGGWRRLRSDELS